MVEAKELRIGNWVVKKETGEHHQVEAADITDCTQKGGFHPVRLDENILTKCGFLYSGDDDIHKSYRHFESDFGIFFDSKNMLYNFVYYNKIGDIWMSHIHVKLENLHQLQNLYFALTNCELDICLK